jgi:hypothetical protein
MTEKKQSQNCSPGVRAVRMAAEHEREHASQWTTIVSIVGKIGCSDLHQSHQSAD